MERILLGYLNKWLISTDRKPLVIRGARQVGKTWLIRRLAETSGKQLIELNFEKQPSYASLFTATNDPHQILLNLSAALNQTINIQHCLLFLDEIQAAPQLFSKLRWFAEELSELPVIAAGSLLEFVFSQYAFSAPVGRISYVYLEPLSFEEFLLAKGKKSLHDYLLKYELNIEIPTAIHEQFITLFKEYIFIGGLPAVVLKWVSEHSLDKVNQTKNDLLATYRDDFSRYRGRIAIERLDEIMMAVPKMLGQKFVFNRVSNSMQSATVKQILNLLENARICYRVRKTSGNGVPLAAEIKEKYFKEIFLDIGLCSTALGLNLNQVNEVKEINMINNGAVAEQVVGQLLRTIEEPYIEPALYCWHREEAGSSAEIDYLIQHGNKVIPIEVKAGSTGRLKSLHLFMGLKKDALAIRINSGYPSTTIVDLKNSMSAHVKYTLVSIPFYLIGQAHRLINSFLNSPEK